LEGSQHLLDLRHRAQENPSSRYHLCSAPLWGRASNAAWIPAAKRKGPKGSPCCTPRVDQMTFRPTSRGAGWNACRTHGIMEGHSRWMASRMAGRAMELRRFASPPAAGATPCSRAGHPPGLALPWPRPRRGSPSRRPFAAEQRPAAALRPWAVASSHFATSLRRVSPTAIGRTPTSFLRSGMRRAAQR